MDEKTKVQRAPAAYSTPQDLQGIELGPKPRSLDHECTAFPTILRQLGVGCII